MASEVISGERWELRRDYISPTRARLITAQAKWVMEQTAYCIATSRHRRLRAGTYGLTSSTLHLRNSRFNQGLPTLEQYPEIQEFIPDILDLFETTSCDTSDSANAISLLRYGPYGRLKWHRDEEAKDNADNTISVTTSGTGYMMIDDPHYGIVRVTTNTGDAVYIDNSGTPDQRLFHRAGNLSFQPRFAYVD